MHHPEPGNITGFLLSTTLAALAWVMEFFHFIAKADKFIFEPMLHLVGILAGTGSFIVAFATIYPPFKEGCIELIDSLRNTAKSFFKRKTK